MATNNVLSKKIAGELLYDSNKETRKLLQGT